MSLECQLGREAGMFEETPERAARLLIDSPVLSESKFRKLIALGNDDANFAHHVIDINYAPSQYSLEGAIQHIRSEEHTSELQSLMRISYAVFCLKKKKNKAKTQQHRDQ